MYSKYTSDLKVHFSYHAVPQPTVDVLVPVSPFYAGTNLTLNCTIMVIEQVDTAVTVTITWTGPGDMELPDDERITVMQPSSFLSTLTLTPLDSGDNGDYTCEANVSADSSEFVSGSTTSMDMQTLILEGKLLQL